MGPVNWLAVILAANLAVAVGVVWNGPLFGTGRPLLQGLGPDGKAPAKNWGIVLAVMLIASAMLGHMYARIGSATLAVKPWLYWMQSGGLAVAFVIPALWLSALRAGADRRVAALDCGFWLVAYLTMGTVFWALG